MNKITSNALKTIYIYIYAVFNFINFFNKHKAIFPYAFLTNSKMYV